MVYSGSTGQGWGKVWYDRDRIGSGRAADRFHVLGKHTISHDSPLWFLQKFRASIRRLKNAIIFFIMCLKRL